MKSVLKIILTRSNDIFRQESLAKHRTLRSVAWNLEYNEEWDTQNYVKKGKLKDRIGIAWFKMGVWKLRNHRKEFEKKKCPLCLEQENEIHIILECNKTKEIRLELIDKKILTMNKKLALSKLINTKNEETRLKFGKYLYLVKKLWEKEILKLSK